jgi:two-component system sensor histidine kinase/response regulator
VAVLSVLVVDDDPVAAHTFTRVLDEHGYHTQMAADGTEIWPVLEQAPVALLVVELEMTGMNGWEVIRRLHPRFASTLFPASACKILAVSRRGDEETVSFVRRLGADAFLVKPVTPITLIRTVDALLSPVAKRAAS